MNKHIATSMGACSHEEIRVNVAYYIVSCQLHFTSQKRICFAVYMSGRIGQNLRNTVLLNTISSKNTFFSMMRVSIDKVTLYQNSIITFTKH